MYADDIAIICDKIDQAENVFRLLEMNASKIGLKINLKNTKIIHAGQNSQPTPVTTLNGCALEISIEFIIITLESQLQRPKKRFWKKMVEHGLQTANSDLFLFPMSVILSRCAFLNPRLKQLQYMDRNQSP